MRNALRMRCAEDQTTAAMSCDKHVISWAAEDSIDPDPRGVKASCDAGKNTVIVVVKWKRETLQLCLDLMPPHKSQIFPELRNLEP